MHYRTIWYGLLALLTTMLAGGVWAALLFMNLATTPAIPWSSGVMAAIFLLAWWTLDRGKLRQDLRARKVHPAVFGWAVLAGMLSIVALAGLWIVLFRMAGMRGNTLPDFSKYPRMTVVAAVLTASLVTALAEEAGFRGFFQSSLERTMSAPMAVLLSSLAIAPGHGLTQGFDWPTVLFYLLVDGMLGTLAYQTKSILPGIVVHAAGLMVFFTMVWPFDAGRAHNGDMWLWLNTAQAVVFGALAWMAFAKLADLTSRREKSAPAYVARPFEAG